MFEWLRSWFDGLSRTKKLAAAVVAAATAVGAIVGAVNGSIDLYERLTENRNVADPLELTGVEISQRKQQPSNMREIYDSVGLTPSEYCAEYESACLVSVLDFKVANAGDDPVVVKRADFKVKKVWTFEAPYEYDGTCGYLYMPPSHNYNVRLPLKDAPYTVTKSLSQSLEPSKSDRFTITLSREERTVKFAEDYALLFTVSLVYGAENNTVSSEDMIYGELGSDVGVFYSYDPGKCMTARKGLEGSDLAKVIKENELAAAEIERTEATRNALLEELLREVT
jgi:hypothetical protein